MTVRLVPGSAMKIAIAKIFQYVIAPGYAAGISIVLLLPGICMDISASEHTGSDTCTQRHAEQVQLWRGSHHDLAMQHAYGRGGWKVTRL